MVVEYRLIRNLAERLFCLWSTILVGAGVARALACTAHRSEEFSRHPTINSARRSVKQQHQQSVSPSISKVASAISGHALPSHRRQTRTRQRSVATAPIRRALHQAHCRHHHHHNRHRRPRHQLHCHLQKRLWGMPYKIFGCHQEYGCIGRVASSFVAHVYL